MKSNPITSLYESLFRRFENNNPIVNDRLSSYSEAEISRKIRFYPEEFNTPQVIFPERQIVLTEGHLSLVWSIIYVVYEIAQNKMPYAPEDITNTYSSVIDGKDPEVQIIDELISWALSIRINWSDWPEHLPNPEHTTKTVKIVNTFFLDAICFMMYHEVAHLVNGHWENSKPILDKRLQIPKSELSDEEKQLLKDLELEADNFAYDCLITMEDNDELKFHKIMSIVFSGISSLFCNEKELLKSSSHPDLHIRVFNIRQKFKFTEGHEFWLDNVMNVGCLIFFRLYNVTYNKKEFKEYTTLMDYLFDKMEMEAVRRNRIDD